MIESEVHSIVAQVASRHGCHVDAGGPLADGRKGVLLEMINKSGNKYQLDLCVRDKQNRPIILIESKYLRYTKHNRDKASWTCVAHHSLRRTYPAIRKSIAVIAGRWSAPSKAMMQSFGIDVVHIPFEKIVKVFAKYKIDFDWHEKDTVTPRRSWNRYIAIKGKQRRIIATQIVSDIRAELEETLVECLEGKHVCKEASRSRSLLRPRAAKYLFTLLRT